MELNLDLLNGIYLNKSNRLFESVPINLVLRVVNSGNSEYYLTNFLGISNFGIEETGRDRCAIIWNDNQYRIQGSSLIRVNTNGTVNIIGDVGDDGFPAFMDYGVDYLAISSNHNLFLYDGDTLQEVTDSNVGSIRKVIWVDGYFLFTDGVDIINTSLSDPFNIDPTSYGTAEVDPDGIVGLLKLTNVVAVIGRYTIEFIQNVGGSGFPFQRNPSMLIMKGCIGLEAYTNISDVIAFVGSSINETLSVYLTSGGDEVNISIPYINQTLQALSIEEQETIKLQSFGYNGEDFLLLYAGNKTFLYNMTLSKQIGFNIWSELTYGGLGIDPYPLVNLVLWNNNYYGANTVSGQIGVLDETVSTYYGVINYTGFNTKYIAKTGIQTINSIEVLADLGYVDGNGNTSISCCYSLDGKNYSTPISISYSRSGSFNKRLVWRPMVATTNQINFRFGLTNKAISIIKGIKVNIEESNFEDF